MKGKSRSLTFILLGLIIGMFAMYLFNNYKIEKKDNSSEKPAVEYSSTSKGQNINYSSDQQSIEQLTNEKIVINYIKQNHRLPDYYITKNEARKQGWNPSKGNLCDALPGKAIGGDKFSNRERSLPEGEKYFEADVNYHCGSRNADRIVFTYDGDIYLTKDHYRSFEKQ